MVVIPEGNVGRLSLSIHIEQTAASTILAGKAENAGNSLQLLDDVRSPRNAMFKGRRQAIEYETQTPLDNALQIMFAD